MLIWITWIEVSAVAASQISPKSEDGQTMKCANHVHALISAWGG